MRLSDIGRLGGDINNETAYVYMNPELELMLPAFLSRGYVDVDEVKYYKTSNSGNSLIRGYDIGPEGILRPEVDLNVVYATYKHLFTTHGTADVGLTNTSYTWYNPWTAQTMSNTSLEIYNKLMLEDPLRFTLIFLARYARRRRAVSSIPSSFNAKAYALVSNVRSNTRYINGGHGVGLKCRIYPKHREDDIYVRTVDAAASLAAVSDLEAYLYSAENTLMNLGATQSALSSISGSDAYNAIIANVDATYYRPYTSYNYPSVEFRNTLTCESGTTSIAGSLAVGSNVTFAPGVMATPLTYSSNLRLTSNIVLHNSVSATASTTVSGNLTMTNNGNVNAVSTNNLSLQGLQVASVCSASGINYNGNSCTGAFSNLIVASNLTSANVTATSVALTSASGSAISVQSNITMSSLTCDSCDCTLSAQSSATLLVSKNVIVNNPVFNSNVLQSSIIGGLVKIPSGTVSSTWTLPSSLSTLQPGKSLEFDFINDSGNPQTIAYTNFTLIIGHGSYCSIFATKASGGQILYASPYAGLNGTVSPPNVATFGTFTTSNVTANTVSATNMSVSNVMGVVEFTSYSMNGSSINTNVVDTFSQTPPTLSVPRVSCSKTTVEYTELTKTLSGSNLLNNITTFTGTSNGTWTLPDVISGIDEGGTFKGYLRNASQGFILTIVSSSGVTWNGTPYIFMDTVLPVVVSKSGGVVSAYPVQECL